MKKFIYQCFTFSVLFILAMIIFSAIKTTLHKPYIIDDKVTSVIIGDSHSQCAINDSLLKGIRNISNNSEGYIYSYFKVKEILEYNPQIRNIIVSFSYHNLSSYYDDFITGKYAHVIMQRYIDLFDYEELFNLFKTNPAMFIMPILKNIIPPFDVYPYIGSYQDSLTDVFNEESMRKRIKTQYFINNELRGVSDINIEYLTKLIELCKRYEVEVTIINTPLHKKYFNEVPMDYVDKYEALIKKFNLPVIDYMELNLSDEHFLPDGDHLNIKGSVSGTKYFIENWHN